MRPDLSQIHPIKRVTLIVVRCLFATSIAFAIGLQFFWFLAGWLLFGMRGDHDGMEFMVRLRGMSSLRPEYLWNGYSAPGGFRGILFSEPLDSLLPGFGFATDGDTLAVSINHLWLISLTAALYIFTRWRIRRTAIHSQTDLQGSFRTSSNPPDGV